MGRLIVRRLISVVPVLLWVSFAVFMLLALVPGDPAVTLAGGADATPAQIARGSANSCTSTSRYSCSTGIGSGECFI